MPLAEQAPAKLRPGNDATEIAVRLLRDEAGKRRWSDFNRLLRYQKVVY
jgi:hypothetical protein